MLSRESDSTWCDINRRPITSRSGAYPVKQNDFISQKYLEDLADQTKTDVTMPPDLLGHDGIVTSIFQAAAALPAGSVVAVHAPWGRGKSDVLLRTALLTWETSLQAEQKGFKSTFARALWINPWQYQTPDMLTPLVSALIERIRKNDLIQDKAAVKATAKKILRSGIKFGLGVAKNLAPLPYLVEAAAGPLDELFEELWGEDDASEPTDPVFALGEAFRELVEQALNEQGEATPQKLLICIDDLDRCLPDRQIALIQAIKFLLASGAPATFVIALDPRLTANALVAHYEISAVDANGYLDKMFDLRLYLTPPGPSETRQLIKSLLDRPIKLNGGETYPLTLLAEALQLTAGSATSVEELSDALLRTMIAADSNNPRFIRRLMDKLLVFTVAAGASGKKIEISSGGTSSEKVVWLCIWLIICERWPEVRTALKIDEYTTITNQLNLYNDYSATLAQDKASIADRTRTTIVKNGLPDPVDDPGFHSFIERLSKHHNIISAHFQDMVRVVDPLLLSFGV